MIGLFISYRSGNHYIAVHPVHQDYKVFVYVIQGKAVFEPVPDNGNIEDYLISTEKLVLFGKGNNLKIATGLEAVPFLLVSGKPLNEPIAWYGSIVMNTRKESETAFSEYEKGTFLKHRV